ncbi:MAG: LacI family DNA-binding transcriptional regulator [Fimbriimonas sp.]|nr:LacI family DNA-binding transcriptional regulator [Fimbriimonas sp.]
MHVRPTIRDVAAKAGVTDMTVSRVVNRSGPVSDAVRARVERAIEELGYVPSRIARGLRSRRTHTLALIVSDITNPFFTTLARGVEDAASDREHLVMVCNTDESEEEEIRYLEMLSGQNVDGVLLVPAKGAEQARALAKRRQLPLVILERRIPESEHSIVHCDTRAGARSMMQYLLGLGHREIAILASPIGIATSDDRVQGALEALEGSDANATVFHELLSRDTAAKGVERCLGMVPRPTAIFALNNLLTIGALRALRMHGARVPEDISLGGFDDLPEPLLERPFLTVVAQPAYEMGRAGVELLIAEISKPTSAPTEIVLPLELVIRGSIGPPPNSAPEG